jgi:predicted outer membrane repeat protein
MLEGRVARWCRFTAAVSLAIGVCPSVFAAVVRVPSEQPTIQAGINAAGQGDTILVAPGVYAGPGNYDLSFGGVDRTLLSEEGPAMTVIRPTDPGRGFYFGGGETASTVICGFTVEEGHAGHGGGAYVGPGSSPRFSKLVFLRNSAVVNGGAICCAVGSGLIVEDSRFEGNTCGREGGAIWWASNGVLEVVHSVFVGNSGEWGGAIYANGFTEKVMLDVLFESNRAEQGGGIQCDGRDLTLARGTFLSNSAEHFGGAVSVGGRNVRLTNVSMVGNEAPSGASVGLGPNGQVYLSHTIVAFSGVGGAISCGSGGDAVLDCCDLFGNAGGDWVAWCIADQANSNGNMSADPLFCGDELPSDPTALHPESPCAPQAGNECNLIGSRGVGCGPTAVRRVTWGQIKRTFE